jgi:hypothetical protein
MGKHTRNGKGVETVTVFGNGEIAFSGRELFKVADSERNDSHLTRIIVSVDAHKPKVVLSGVPAGTRVVVNGKRYN